MAVTGLTTWLETWNRLAGVVIATKPAKALQMIKYQTLITAAFQDYAADACIEYDDHFRQFAAKEKSVHWDKYKKDIFVRCFSPKSSSADLCQTSASPFATTSQMSCHVSVHQQTLSHIELKSHTDPAWIYELITGITTGVSLGYHSKDASASPET